MSSIVTNIDISYLMSEVDIYIFQSEKVLYRKVVAQTKNIDVLLQRRINTSQKVKDFRNFTRIGG